MRVPRDVRRRSARRVESRAGGSLRVPGQAALRARSASPSPKAASRRRPRRRARRPRRLGGPVVVKAQVLTGGRGKAGGVKLADDPGRRRSEGARHPRPRHQRPRRAEAVDRAGVRHREGVLPLDHLRPRREAAALHAHDARAASRSSRSPRRTRTRSRDCTSIRSRASSRIRRGGSSTARRSTTRASRSRSLGDRREALPLLRRVRRDAHRDQPADRHARRRGAGARLEVHRRRQRALPPSGHRGDARRRSRRPASRRSRARRASPT